MDLWLRLLILCAVVVIPVAALAATTSEPQCWGRVVTAVGGTSAVLLAGIRVLWVRLADLQAERVIALTEAAHHERDRREKIEDLYRRAETATRNAGS